MRDLTAMPRMAMFGLACASIASCATHPPTTPPPPPLPPIVGGCPGDSPYVGPQKPVIPYTVRVMLWQTTAGPKVKPEPVNVGQGHPGLCIDDDGNLHIYRKDAAEVDIRLQLDPNLGVWYPDATQAFQVDHNALIAPPAFLGSDLVVKVKAKGPGFHYDYWAWYVDKHNNTVHTEPGIQNH
jgi:hypothetical protein